MKKFNTGNIDLDKWILFYNNKTTSNTKFIQLLKKLDKSFLTMAPYKDIDDQINDYLPDNGLLEKDLKKIMFNKTDNNLKEKSRIVLSVINNVNFENWKIIYSSSFYEVIEKSLIEGDYELLDISLEKIISIFINKNLIKKNDFMDICILRGIKLGERYPTTQNEKKLKYQIKINKIKILLGV